MYRDFATLRASAAGLKRLRGFSPVVAQAAQRTAAAPDAEGWVTVTVPIESVEHAAREMLKLGADAEVLEPAELRSRLAARGAGDARALRRIEPPLVVLSRPWPPTP